MLVLFPLLLLIRAGGTVVDSATGMNNPTPTVEMSLDALSEACTKSSDDLRAVKDVLERARGDIASRNTSISRRIVTAAERVVDHLKKTDEALKEVLVALEERD